MSRTSPKRVDRIDLLFLMLLVLAGATASWIGADRVHTQGSRASNVWFQADVSRVYDNMTRRRSNHYRTKVHPIFSIATNPPVKLLKKAGLDKERAVRTLMAGAAGLWLAILYGVLRAFGLRRPDAVVFAGLAAVSSSAVFWSTVPETYIFGSTTLLLLMGFAAYASTRKFASGWFVGFSALSLSMTVTNWMAGLLVTWLNNPWRRSVRITLDAFLLITLVWALQHAFFPGTEFFLLSLEERNYMLVEAAGGLAEKLTGFFFHPMVMPLVPILDNPSQPAWPLFSIQFAPIGSTGALGWAMTLLWIGLLAFGIRALLSRGALDKPRIALGLLVFGQLALHLVYGEETFLYSLHWLPLLVIVAGIGTLGPQRWAVLAAGAVLAVGAGVNNVGQFARVTSELSRSEGASEASERARDGYPETGATQASSCRRRSKSLNARPCARRERGVTSTARTTRGWHPSPGAPVPRAGTPDTARTIRQRAALRGSSARTVG